MVDPLATAAQKNVVALGPKIVVPGTAALLLRHVSSAQVTGSVHCVFVFGPVGPLFGPLSFWPHRPLNASQAYGAVAEAGAAGRRTTVVCVFVDGPRVSSQPNPSCALAPSQSLCSKKFACEPAAA